MGRQSKATKAWHSNLGWINNPQNPSVEDAFKDEDLDFEDGNNLLEHGFFFLDDESPSEEDSDSEDDKEPDEDELGGLIDEAKINRFNTILFEAQAMKSPNVNDIILATQLVLDNIMLRNINKLQQLVKNSLTRGFRRRRNLTLQLSCHQKTWDQKPLKFWMIQMPWRVKKAGEKMK